MRKNIQRAIACRLIPQQRRAVQRALHHEADLAGMRRFARLDRPLDRRQHARRKNFPYPPAVFKQMFSDAFDAHISPTPRRTAAAKTAAAAAESAAVTRTAAARIP